MTVTIIEFVAYPKVYQATGMISVLAGVDVTMASVWLRSMAATFERRVVELAADVVARRIRFDGPT